MVTRQCQFNDVDLRHTEFNNDNLTSTDRTDVDARNTNFTHMTLYDTVLTVVDCHGGTFSALLYETVFTDIRINSQTTFHEPETIFYDSITSRPAVVYEENTLALGDLPEETYLLEAAK